MRKIWIVGSVVKDQKYAEIVPIIKKRDLKKCDNWRGNQLARKVVWMYAAEY